MIEPSSYADSARQIIAPAHIRTYVVNLQRRSDRRRRMEHILPPDIKAVFTSDWAGPFDGHDLTRSDLEAAGYKLFPWQIDSANTWWSRPLKYGEIGCVLAHLACWRHAATTSEPYILILEDDAILVDDFAFRLRVGLARLADRHPFDLLYLGRYPIGRDESVAPGIVAPGYSHCTFGYVLTRSGLDALLAARLEEAIVPVDEFLPSFYIDHPREDLRERFPKQLRALAFDPPLVRQLPKEDAGSDTEDSDFVEP